MSQSNDDYDRTDANNFNAVKISLADPRRIREESHGEVKKPETINYRTFKPERDGLFCERIFGPEKDWECSCGHYRGMKYKGLTCDRCGVTVDRSRVRRKRMGHIELKAPVVHIWFFKGGTDRLATLLAIKSKDLEKIIYYTDYIVLDPGQTDLKLYEVLSAEALKAKQEEYGYGSFKVGTGAEAVRTMLSAIDLVKESKLLQEKLKNCNKTERKTLTSRLRLIEHLRTCKQENNPAWMVLDVIPVIPPDLRPLVMLESGAFATSDLNDLYRRIINRNNRLTRLIHLTSPDLILNNEKRMLQYAVDALFDNMRCKKQVNGSSNRPLKSLTELIKGKQGRFRENLLGKRVDYSARSVIVVGPHLRLHQCGLPKRIALELYQPFVIRRMRELQCADTIKSAKKMIERRDVDVWDILEEVIQNHPVLLNRAPTLHRMSIQAFEPTLIEGNAIKLHPLVCKGFNADFDGDQMSVHLPLSLEAKVEAHTLMLSTNNIFSPANGGPIISPSQDIVMGCYYITIELPGMKGEGMAFSSIEECLLAYSLGKVHLQAKIKVRMPKGRFLKNDPSITEGKLFETTPGRIIFNQILSEGMPFYNIPQQSKELARVISDCHELLGRRATIDLLDKMMRLGFEESTKSGLSFAADDLITPKEKKTIVQEADREVQSLQRQARAGTITEEERYSKVLDIWSRVKDEVAAKMMETFRNDVHKTEEEAQKAGDIKRRPVGYVNPVYLMSHSGARGGEGQILQLAGIRGLMAKPNGTLIETPVKANFLEGLNVLEYFGATHGARKGLSDTALKTSNSGYLTRKLADVSHTCVVTMYDCGTTNGVNKRVIPDGDRKIPLSQSILGRVSCEPVADNVTDEQIVPANGLITAEIARRIDELPITTLKVRSPLTCEAENGVCALCYGMDLSTQRLVEEGMAVGIIAAQSIGEPGTQLTMRTFHIGGVGEHSAEENEIKTKYAGYIRFTNMEVVYNSTMGAYLVLSCRNDGGIEICRRKNGPSRETYPLPEGAVLCVKEDDYVDADATLCTVDPHNKLLIAKSAGIVQFVDIDDTTSQTIEDQYSKQKRLSIVELKGDSHPTINILDHSGGKINETFALPSKTQIEVERDTQVERGTVIAKMPLSAGASQDITRGLPRVEQIFEARAPEDPAILAEVDGVVEILDKRLRGKRVVVIKQPEAGPDDEGRSHEIPQGKVVRVFTGDEIKAGQPLTDGLPVPEDILRVSGEVALQDYLLQEVQAVYRSQSVGINDKHIEIIISQMLRRVRIDNPGDSGFLLGDLVDKFQFRRRNEELRNNCVKITDPGDTTFDFNEIVSKKDFEECNAEVEARGYRPASSTRPKLASASPKLLGITRAAVQSDSFLSAAGFQETTKVLTDAALACKVDHLVGLKENVMLGRLIPAGTGFNLYQKGVWRYTQKGEDDLTLHAGMVTPDSYDTTLLRASSLQDGDYRNEGVLGFNAPTSDDAFQDSGENAVFDQDDSMLGDDGIID
ncbi:MAG: DNA-directed RNA polymerase subunit beta' [Planctomycetia bacterium]|nr:DNA-directed RNA polymerase subunit beta' [Planctomycetia bacterium]